MRKARKTKRNKSFLANLLLQTCSVHYITWTKPWKLVGAKHRLHDDKCSVMASDHLSCRSNEKIQVNFKVI